MVSLSIRRGPDVLTRMFGCDKTVLLTTRFFNGAKFTVLTALSLLPWCSLLFSVVCLNIFSLQTDVSYGTYENNRNPALIYHKNRLLNHHLLLTWCEPFKTITLHQRPLTTLYDTLSLTNSFLTVDTLLLCTKFLLPIDAFHLLLYRKITIPCSHRTPLSQ